jgi:uncharacterized protein
MQNKTVGFNQKPTIPEFRGWNNAVVTSVPQFRLARWWKMAVMTVQELLEFRRRKDDFFASSQSPLALEARQGFAGLAYFEYQPELSFTLSLKPAKDFEHVMMETSAGVRKSFVRAGWLEFAVAGTTVNLTAYSNPESEDQALFIPFRDATSGTQTYPSGRYLDSELASDGTVLLDFNLAYNPYCAYSDGWSCPIPPLENWLDVPILAGEKVFGDQQ